MGIIKILSNTVFKHNEKVQAIGLMRVITYFIFQRIFRVNSHVPWPVHWSSFVDDPDKIKRKGDLPYPGYMLGCYIQAANGIEIGKNVRIGPSVKLISANHDIYDYDKFIKTNPIILNDNCWLASNVTILPGVEIGEHTIVAAGAVVTKSFKQGNCILAGVPAKVVKTISAYKENKAL